jgi:preprotein translocase subunit YajC
LLRPQEVTTPPRVFVVCFFMVNHQDAKRTKDTKVYLCKMVFMWFALFRIEAARQRRHEGFELMFYHNGVMMR